MPPSATQSVVARGTVAPGKKESGPSLITLLAGQAITIDNGELIFYNQYPARNS